MQLCCFSKSEILQGLILKACPLDLTATEAKSCPCRKRLYHVPPADLRVLSCTYPDTWRGEPIRNPEALKRKLTTDRKTKQADTRIERSLAKMSTTETRVESKPAETNGQQQQPMSTAVAVQKAGGGGSLSVFDAIMRGNVAEFINGFGQVLYDSKMFGIANPAQGKALAFMFLVKKMDPFDFRRRHHVIGGNVTMSAKAMLADFRTICGGSHRIITRTHDKAAVELTLKRDKQLFEFTLAEALQADYPYTNDANNGKVKKVLPNGQPNPAAFKENWSTPHKRMQMLWARLIADAVGAMAPEVSGGRMAPEELGVLAEDAQTEGITDADFTVVNDTTVQPQSFEGGNETVVDVQPEPPVEQPQTSPPGGLKGDPLAKPEPEKPPFDASNAPHAAAADAKMALLKQLGPLKRELLTDEQYSKVLMKYGVTTAKELGVEELQKIVSGLEARKRAKTQSDELSQWANGIANGGAAGGPSPGN